MGKRGQKPQLAELMELGVGEKVFPGGVLLVGLDGQMVHGSVHGQTSLCPEGDPISMETCFDLASLTKVLATSSVAVKLLEEHRLELDSPIRCWLKEYRGGGREKITVRHLLEHSSGLAAWRPYYQELAAVAGGSWLASAKGRDAIRRMVAKELPQTPPGDVSLYSDLGFVLLDWVLERIGGMPLNELFRTKISAALKLGNLFFVDLKKSRMAHQARRGKSFAATEQCPWRGRTLVGEVHDDNCYAMGGVSGHAGLFGNAQDVFTLAHEWLRAYEGKSDFFDPDWVRRFWQKSKVLGSIRALGFDSPSEQDSSAGQFFSPGSVGHLGFTGTSLWIDPARALIVVLLTNRVHPSRENEAIRWFRPKVHDLIHTIFFQ